MTSNTTLRSSTLKNSPCRVTCHWKRTSEWPLPWSNLRHLLGLAKGYDFATLTSVYLAQDVDNEDLEKIYLGIEELEDATKARHTRDAKGITYSAEENHDAFEVLGAVALMLEAFVPLLRPGFYRPWERIFFQTPPFSMLYLRASYAHCIILRHRPERKDLLRIDPYKPEDRERLLRFLSKWCLDCRVAPLHLSDARPQIRSRNTGTSTRSLLKTALRQRHEQQSAQSGGGQVQSSKQAQPSTLDGHKACEEDQDVIRDENKEGLQLQHTAHCAKPD